MLFTISGSRPPILCFHRKNGIGRRLSLLSLLWNFLIFYILNKWWTIALKETRIQAKAVEYLIDKWSWEVAKLMSTKHSSESISCGPLNFGPPNWLGVWGLHENPCGVAQGCDTSFHIREMDELWRTNSTMKKRQHAIVVVIFCFVSSF